MVCTHASLVLPEMTATMRRIDLAATILAPVVTGEIMFFTQLRNGAIFMAAWNLGTVFLEYYLLWKVYVTVPALQKAKIRNKGSYPKSIQKGKLHVYHFFVICTSYLYEAAYFNGFQIRRFVLILIMADELGGKIWGYWVMGEFVEYDVLLQKIHDKRICSRFYWSCFVSWCCKIVFNCSNSAS